MFISNFERKILTCFSSHVTTQDCSLFEKHILQAEEAKKLRKRKKAEALRLLDMERKQKQRLQAVRESQKKVPYFAWPN
jgi:hypothetical protein